jgi:hydrogenase nickel incorporation protein HypB
MEVRVLTIKEDILGVNEKKAKSNRERLDKHGILAVNLMSSPGAGKTSLIWQTLDNLKPESRVAVIEGDVASQVDADRLHEQGVPIVQINIPGGCHLDANMVDNALDNLPLEELDLILIENVGNLVCPAEFDLGEHKRAVLSSMPEGDDKPYKYPLMFTEADVVLVNKLDLLPHLDFQVDSFRKGVTRLNPSVEILEISCKTGEGLEPWLSWLRSQMKDRKARQNP